MKGSTVVMALFLALGGVLLAALGVSNWRLSQRVTALEMVAARGLVRPGEAPADAPDVDAIESAVAALRVARSGEGSMSEEEAVALIEATLDDTLDRKADERKTAEVDQYMKMAEESIRVDVEDLIREFDLPDDKVQRVVDLLVQGMYEGHELREDLKAGNITMREAKEEGEVIKKEYADALIELLGQEAYEELGRKFYGEQGWAAAR